MPSISAFKFSIIPQLPLCSPRLFSPTSPSIFRKFRPCLHFSSSASISRRALFRRKSSEEEAYVAEAEEDEWLQKLPEKNTALYSHSLPCVEAWLRSLGFYQSRDDRAVWFVEKPDWHAQLSLDVTDLHIRRALAPPLRLDASRRSEAVAGLGIRIAIKPEYRITPPPPLLPHLGEIPRSNFHFDFEFERNVLMETVKENPNWGRLGIDNAPPKAAVPTPSYGQAADPVVSKYIAAGLSREAVPLAVANYGDNPSKVKEFANGFTLLGEMGFSSNNVAEALIMYDNDTDKALAQLINAPS